MMPNLFLIFLGLVLFVQLFWLVYLTLSFRRLKDEMNHFHHRSSVSRKSDTAAERLHHTVANLTEQFHDITRRLSRLEPPPGRSVSARLPDEYVENSLKPERTSLIRSPEVADNFSGTISSSGDDGFLHSVTSAFNRLAQDFQQSLLKDFSESYKPKTFAIQNGEFIENLEGPFWIIEIPDSGPSCLILPSGKVTKDWDKFYRSMQGLKAKDDLSDVFEIAEAGHLSVSDPAIGSLNAAHITLLQKGKLAGI